MPSSPVRKRFGLIAAAAAIALPVYAQVAKGPEKDSPAAAPPLPVAEARARARLVHTTISGALQVMHRDFFRRNGSKVIPSKSLEDVFKSLAEESSIEARWLAGEGTVMNTDNKPRDDFEQKAIKKIVAGEKEYESAEKGTFRFAGAITLQNECLKCHVPDRTSLEDRFAALVVSIPLNPPAPEK
jgi:hypothetical protein